MFANGITINNTGTHVYINSQDSGDSNIYHCSVNPADGTFISCQITAITTPPNYYANYGFLILNPSNTLAYLLDGLNSRVLACPLVYEHISSICTDTGATNLNDSIVGITLNKAGTIAYIVDYSGLVTVCSVSDAVFSGCTQYTGDGSITFDRPADVALNNAETHLYVTDYIESKVFLCKTDFSNCTVAGNVNGPYGIALNKTNSFAYITNYSDTYACPINNDGSLNTCTLFSGFAFPTDVTLGY